MKEGGGSRSASRCTTMGRGLPSQEARFPQKREAADANVTTYVGDAIEFRDVAVLGPSHLRVRLGSRSRGDRRRADGAGKTAVALDVDQLFQGVVDRKSRAIAIPRVSAMTMPPMTPPSTHSFSLSTSSRRAT